MWQKNVRYLDYNATSGLSDSVRRKLTELLADPEILANPSSRHRPGQRARRILFEASLRIAKSLSGDHPDSISPDDLLFTSSGTEANQSVLASLSFKTDLLIIGSGEHSSSIDWVDTESKKNSKFNTQALNLLPNGQYDFHELEQILETAVAQKFQAVGLSLTLANNETGVLLNLDGLAEVIRKAKIKVILHLDGAQVWGKQDVNLAQTHADFITFSSHKIGAPSGTGVVWIKKNATFSPLILGTQNRGLRGGSENLLGIAACGFAAETLNPHSFAKTTAPLVVALEAGLKECGAQIKIWGENSPRVPNTSRFSIQNFKTYENWVELLDLKGYAVSHGSACKAQIIEPSRVLLKMGASHEDALNSLRISFGPANTKDDVDGFLEAFTSILKQKALNQK